MLQGFERIGRLGARGCMSEDWEYIEECNCSKCVKYRGGEVPMLTEEASEGQEAVMRRAFGLPS